MVDVNIWISYLLSSDPSSPIRAVLDSGLRRQYTLVFADQLVDELTRAIHNKPYLAGRIPPEALALLLERLAEVAVPVFSIAGPLERVVRDPKDDYLIAYARRGHAEYLVSGERDLLALASTITRPRIVSPAEVVALLG